MGVYVNLKPNASNSATGRIAARQPEARKRHPVLESAHSNGPEIRGPQVSLDPRTLSAAPNGSSVGSAVFAQLTVVPTTQTYTETDAQTTLRATSALAIDRIYAPHALDAV